MLYKNPKSILEAKLNEVLGPKEETILTDLMKLSLLKRGSCDPDDLVYEEIFSLLGFEKYTDLVALLDGRTVTFPTKEEFKDSLINLLCYYYRDIEGRGWDDIRNLLGLQDINPVREGIKASQFGAFIKKMIEKEQKHGSK